MPNHQSTSHMCSPHTVGHRAVITSEQQSVLPRFESVLGLSTALAPVWNLPEFPETCVRGRGVSQITSLPSHNYTYGASDPRLRPAIFNEGVYATEA